MGYAFEGSSIVSYVASTLEPEPTFLLSDIVYTRSLYGDRNGNLLATVQRNGDGGLQSLLCVARDGSGIAELDRLAGEEMGLARAGANGLVYGTSSS